MTVHQSAPATLDLGVLLQELAALGYRVDELAAALEEPEPDDEPVTLD
jgi:hypothetical protein